MGCRWIFFDLETTGRFPNSDRITEIAAYDLEKKNSFSSLVNPGISIPKETVAFNGISDEMVKDSPQFPELIAPFLDFCSGDVALVAHNGENFDWPFLAEEMKRANKSLPQNILLIDSLKWARYVRKDLPRHSLQYLRTIYDIPPNQAHRALDDVMVLAAVFMNLVDDLSCEQVQKRLEKAYGKAVLPDFSQNTQVHAEETLSLFR
jgi:DNA polymerase III subunit epsilon